MYILGLNAGGKEGAACLVKEGQLIAVAEEERFTRRKHQGGFPEQSVLYCLEEAHISLVDVDYVASCWKPGQAIVPASLHILKYLPRSLHILARGYKSGYLPKFSVSNQLRRIIPSERKPKFKYIEVDHHISHAASAFYVSGFEEAAILTFDGMGEWTTTFLAQGKGNRIEPLGRIPF